MEARIDLRARAADAVDSVEEINGLIWRIITARTAVGPTFEHVWYGL